MTPDWMTRLDDGFAEGVAEALARRWGGRPVGVRQGEGVGGGSAVGSGVPQDAGTPNAGAGSGVAANLSTLTATRHIFNGFYTLVLPDGGHRTFRVHTQSGKSKFAPGRRVVSLLIGPDNTADYEGVAFLEAGGIKAWKRHAGTRVEVHLGILWELMSGKAVERCEILVSRRCLVCNRTLTDNESIDRGIGPSCWERMQHGR